MADAQKEKAKPNFSGAVAEFSGALVLAFLTAYVGGNTGRTTFGIDPVGPFVIGFAYLGLLSAFAHVSGGYFNPALTLLGVLFKRVTPVDFVLFFVAQIAGAFAGAGIASGLSTTDVYNTVGYSFEESEAIFVEIVFSAVLFHVYVLTVHPRTKKVASNSWFGMSFGFTFIGLSAAAANISGGVFNPAVGLAVQSINAPDADLWYIYLFAPFVAVFLALVVGAFTATRMPNTNRPYFHLGGAILFELFHTAAMVAVTALVGRSFRAGPDVTSPVISNPWWPLVLALFYGGQVYAGRKISGGHINPAVTLGVFLSQKYFLARSSHGTADNVKDPKVARWWKVVIYWIAQIVGGTVGALVAVRMHATDVYAADPDEFFPSPRDWNSDGSIEGEEKFRDFVFEAVYTGFIVFVFLCTSRSASTKGNNFFGLASTLMFAAAAFSYGRSALSLNPATGLGLIWAADADGIADAGRKSWIYILAPLLGGLVAPFLYRITNEPEFVEEVPEGQPGGRQLDALGPIFNEFLGPFIFVCTLVTTNEGGNGVFSFATGLSGACILAAVIIAAAHTSGGHHNPSVTIAAWLTGGITWDRAIAYIFGQVFGAVLGGVLGKYLVDGAVVAIGPQPGGNGDWLAFLAEFLFTAFLAFTALSTGSAANQAKHAGNRFPYQYYGLSVGFTVLCAAASIGPYSGAAINPSVATGLMVSNGSSDVIDKLWLYWLAEVVGSFAAAALVHACFEKDLRGAAARNFDAVRDLIAEFVGSFYIFLVAGLALGVVNSGGVTSDGAFMQYLAIGAVYMIVTNQFEGVSGSHFNPAITVATECVSVTNLGLQRVCLYVVSQLLGGIFGALVANTFGGMAYAPWVTETNDSFRALVGEFIAVTAIVTVFLNVMHSRRNKGNTFFGMAIGFTYAAFTATLFTLSRAGFNPAVTGLVAVNGTSTVADDLWIYWVGPLLGALLAAGIFLFTSAVSPMIPASA